MKDLEFITPQHLLLMTVEDYLKAFGNKAVSERFIAILSTKLARNADRLRHNLIGGKSLSKDGEPLVVGDLIRIPHPYLRRVRIGKDSVHFISEALERNELRLNMDERAIEHFIETYDVVVAKLRKVLECVCKQCIREKKRDFSRIFDRRKEIMPGFDCYVLVTRI